MYQEAGVEVDKRGNSSKEDMQGGGGGRDNAAAAAAFAFRLLFDL